MLVQINNLVSGTCVLCCKKANDTVDANFKDGLKGTFCKKHFWEAVESRAQQSQQPLDNRETTKGSPST